MQILVKCDCGCIMTIRDRESKKPLVCQNCGKELDLYKAENNGDGRDEIMFEPRVEFSVVPDNAKISVTFSVETDKS